MIDLPLDPELAERSRAMFLLDARIAAARAELARLREAGVDGERRLVNRHDERLLRANERLVISAIEALESAAVATGLNQRDLLTGIPNRGLTLDRLETALAAARRNTRRVGVVFVDLDAFKSINDTRGHAAGDRALQAAAHRLTASVRGSDTVGRLGGDEFLAILPEIDGALDASRVVAKMGSAIGAPHDDADDAPPLSASIGVAVASSSTTAARRRPLRRARTKRPRSPPSRPRRPRATRTASRFRRCPSTRRRTTRASAIGARCSSSRGLRTSSAARWRPSARRSTCWSTCRRATPGWRRCRPSSGASSRT